MGANEKRTGRAILVAAALALLAASAHAAQSSEPVPLRRFALVAGSNAGGEGRVPLKYATSDAREFAGVLGELGGVRPEDLILLADPNLAEFQSAIRKAQTLLKSRAAAGERREFLFYYSGHSDEEGLILGTERFPYDTLRKLITDIPADVRVAILDSCSSGALTRAKGGVTRPAFLFDASADMKGHAFLTSSSAEEAAQESDRIGASFFTHYLISALRGAADNTGDGLVTLNEAYAFAFQETLASTERTQYGPQHPAYDINLTGSGDLVLTDLRAASAGLTIPENISGRLYIRNSKGALAIELAKAEGQRTELALSPGSYTVLLDKQGSRYGADLRVAANKRTVLEASALKPVSGEVTIARGDQSETTEVLRVPFSISIIPEITAGVFSSRLDRVFSLNALAGSAAYTSGFQASGLVSLVSKDVAGFQASGLGNIVLGDVSGFQAAGLLNYNGGDARFFQTAGILNVSGGDFGGFQSAGIGNYVGGSLSGLQLAGLFSRAWVLDAGFQVSGIAGFTGGDSSGAQVSGVFNLSGETLKGVQVAGVVNYAKEISGPQIAVLNVASNVTGAQVGIVNIAREVKGTQIGVLNISRRIDGIPFGLITIEEMGRQQLELWIANNGMTTLAFALGSKHTYTLFITEWMPDTSPQLWGYGLGFGGRVTVGNLFIDFDASCLSEHEGFTDWAYSPRGTLIPQGRLILGVPLVGDLAVQGGVAVRFYVPEISPSPDGSALTQTRAIPSFIFGVQL